MGDVTCTLRVTATEHDPVRVAVRRHQFLVGRPIEFDEQSPHVSACEYVLGAVGAEVIAGLKAFARRRRLHIDQVEAVVTGDIENPLTYLEVIGETGTPRIARIHIKVFAASPDEQMLRCVWDETLGRLPLASTLRAAVRVDLELVLTA